jgi:hypothetical protein
MPRDYSKSKQALLGLAGLFWAATLAAGDATTGGGLQPAARGGGGGPPRPSDARSPVDDEPVKPDPSDAVAAPRAWRDATGEHSVQARLQSVERDAVILKRDDGGVVTVPRAKLHKDDRELLRQFLMNNSKKVLLDAVASFRKASSNRAELGDTDVRIAESLRRETEKLRARVNGREIRLVFPIRNVAEYPNPSGDTAYRLELGAPDIPNPTTFGLDYSSRDQCWYDSGIVLRMSRGDALKIGKGSELVMEGSVRVTVGSAPPPVVLRWLGVELTMESRRMQVRDAGVGGAGTARTVEGLWDSAGATPKSPPRKHGKPGTSYYPYYGPAWR